MPETETTSASDLMIRRQGRAGRITLNRPRALNALAYEMVAPMAAALEAWARDEAVELVLLDGAGERGLCAGGDVISLYDSRTGGSGFARRFWADEYRLNARIARYPKPFVALADGIVMGGGIGLAAHASHRIVTERSMLAMPETAIGLIPDVGGTWLLSRAPGATGRYLALTGFRMNAADALHTDLADSCVASARLPELVAALCDTGEPISVTIAGFTAAPPAAKLAPQLGEIEAAFSADTIEEIMARLAAMPGEWAARTLSGLQSASPLALKATLAALDRARALPSLEAALAVEYRLTVRLFEAGEFPEGIRALLIDKDRKPRWRPPRLADVTPQMVEALLEPLPAGEEWQA